MAVPDQYNIGGAAYGDIGTTPVPMPTTQNNISSSVGGSDIVNALVRYYSAAQSGENLQDAQDALARAVAAASSNREGLKADSYQFHDTTAKTLASDVNAWLGQIGQSGAGAARGEQYGKDLTAYADRMTQQGLGRIDAGVGAGLDRLGSARTTALSDLGAIFNPALADARGEVSHQRGLGQEVIDFTRSGAEDARRITTPMLESAAARFQTPNQYTDSGIRGILSRAALAGVTDAFDNTQRGAINQAVRSGSGGGELLSALARERSDASSRALLDAAAKSIGMASGINTSRRTGEAQSFAGLSDSLRAREALVPQAYDIASKGSLGAQGLVSALSQAYGAQTGQTNNQYMSGITDLSKTGINAGNDLLRTGMATGAQGYDLSARSAVSGDQGRDALTKSLMDNYFAGMRTSGNGVMQNLSNAWVSDTQANSGLAKTQANTSVVQGQTDPWGVAAGQLVNGVAGKAIGKGLDWVIDKGGDWISGLFG